MRETLGRLTKPPSLWSRCLRLGRPSATWRREVIVKAPGVLGTGLGEVLGGRASLNEGEQKDGANVAGETGSNHCQFSLAGAPWLGLGECTMKERTGLCPCEPSVCPLVNGECRRAHGEKWDIFKSLYAPQTFRILKITSISEKILMSSCPNQFPWVNPDTGITGVESAGWAVKVPKCLRRHPQEIN